jgi:hypothetical protein
MKGKGRSRFLTSFFTQRSQVRIGERLQVWFTKTLAVLLALILSGALHLAHAQSSGAAGQPAAGTQASPASPGVVNPAQGPLEPVPPAAESSGQSPNPAPPAAPTPQANTKPPVGAAVGQTGRTLGGPASKPAGYAIAPAKQNQSRVFWIKVGVVAAAGVALGTVIALSRGTGSKPPGAK